MIKQNWEIGDKERVRILSLHEYYTKANYILKEQNETRTESITIPLDLNWGMGKYKITPTQQTAIQGRLREIQNFIVKHKNSNITIQIEAGESRVTNFDTEGGGKKELAQGVLAGYRANNIIEFLKSYFENLVNSQLIPKVPNFPEPIITIGQTPYTKGSGDLKDPSKIQKYKSEQFVRATISLSKNYDCIVGLEITVGYFPRQNSGKHVCDESIFELKMNGVSLGEVNLNNSILDVKQDQIEAKYIKDVERYNKMIEKTNKTFTSLVNNGLDKEKNRDKYVKDAVGEPPVKQELPEQLRIRAQKLGYQSVEQYMVEIKKINDTFKSYGRKSDGANGGSRSQTFVIDGAKAKSIIENAPSDKIVLSIVPLVSKDGKYKIFYHSGSHSDTPWVTIKSRKSEQPLFNGEPNINMQRGSTKETILLETDLCGNPIKKV